MSLFYNYVPTYCLFDIIAHEISRKMCYKFRMENQLQLVILIFVPKSWKILLLNLRKIQRGFQKGTINLLYIELFFDAELHFG